MQKWNGDNEFVLRVCGQASSAWSSFECLYRTEGCLCVIKNTNQDSWCCGETNMFIGYTNINLVWASYYSPGSPFPCTFLIRMSDNSSSCITLVLLHAISSATSYGTTIEILTIYFFSHLGIAKRHFLNSNLPLT